MHDDIRNKEQAEKEIQFSLYEPNIRNSFMFIRCSRSIMAYLSVNNNNYHRGELL